MPKLLKICLLLLCLNGVFAEEPAPSMRYKLLPLAGLRFEELDRVCRPWLSPGGILTHEAPRESILVYDRPEVIARISGFIESHIEKPLNVMVEVEYSGVSAKAKAKPFSARGKSGDSYTSMSVLAGNGLPASLWACQTVVDPSWLQMQKLLSFQAVVVADGHLISIQELGPGIRWADVGAKLMVRPLYDELTGNVSLELFPVLSVIDGKGRTQALKVESLSTTIVVKEGQRVNIGSMISAKSSDYLRLLSGRQTFAVGTSNEVSITDITVTCRAMRPDGLRKNSPPKNRDYENPMDNFRR